jgi:transcription termination factor Rho
MADEEPSSGEELPLDPPPKKKTVKRARTRTPRSKVTEEAEAPADVPSETPVPGGDEGAPSGDAPAAETPAPPEGDAPAPAAQPGSTVEPSADYGQDGGWKSGGGKRGKGKKGSKWKKRDPKDRPPAQPLPPGMEEVKVGELPDPTLFEDMEALDTEAAKARSSSTEPIDLEQMYPLGIADLGAKGTELGAAIEGVPTRRGWLEAIFKTVSEKEIPLYDHGYLDMTDDGYGFVVHPKVAYRLYPENSYMPASLVKRYGLKRGHEVKVIVRPPKEGERCPAVIAIEEVMGKEPAAVTSVTPFEELEPYYPLQRILMEAPVHKDISMRAVDLLTPIGFGQRGLIVAPPRTGKTVLLQNMANSISHNFPEAKLILLLIDERPEEVTDFKRHTHGEVVSSTFDEAPTNHVHAAEMVIEKARRLVEQGEHVVILLDSITRLARAYNALASNSGKIMSGGIEATALQKPKRFFGSARNIEGGGSLTVLGTALIDTNSKMDEVIFEEFKGTGNMELHLDRGLSDKRIFPAINIDRSGTRKEELIYHPDEMQKVYGLRRAMQGIPPVEAMEMFIKRLKKTNTNIEFLMSLNS